MSLAQVLPPQEAFDRDVSISDNNWLDAFRVPFGEWINMTVDWINRELQWLTDAIKWPFQFLFDLIMNENPANDSIMSISWLWLVIGMFLLGSFTRNTRIGLMVAGMTALCGFLGQEYWEQVSKTFGMIIISVALCVLIGIPLGILCGRFDGVWNVTRPVLDAMQVVHSFVWMIPFIFFFGLGNVPATMVTMTYALPPLVRLTNLGIRQVPEDVVEASRSYGATELRVLTDVQLPLARPAIMTGFNQTLLLAFSMLGIAAYMGADGLGKLIFRAINNVNIALGAGAGLTFFLCAVILDRISQPEHDDGLSLFARVRQAFDYRKDPEGTYLEQQGELADEIAAVATEPAITEYPEPIRAAERTGLLVAIAGSVVAIIATLMPWGNDAGGVSSWGRALDESLPGQSFNGLSASGGSFFGIFVLGLSVLALLAAVRPLISFPESVSRQLNRLQGLGLLVLAGLLAISLVLNLANVGFDGIQVLALWVFALIGLLVIADTFVRGSPRLANDGALIAALGAFGVAVAWLIEQPSPAVVDYSDGIGVWIAIIGSGAAVLGALMSVLRAPYASRVPLPSGLPSPVAMAGIVVLWVLTFGVLRYITNDGFGPDQQLSDDGTPNLWDFFTDFWPSLLFGLVVTAVVLGALLALRVVTGRRLGILSGVEPSMTVIAAIATFFTWVGARAAWVVDERAGADAANRIFHRGLTDNGPLMGWPVLIFGLAAVVVALAIGLTSPQGPARWRLGAVVCGLATALIFMSLAFTLSVSRNGDTDYLNDRNALTGAGILLAITAGGALFSIGRGVLRDFRRKRIYLGEGPVIEDEAVIDASDPADELVGAAR